MEDHNEDTQECLANKDNDVALECLKKVVAHYKNSAGCNPRLVLLSQDGCIPCEEEAALHLSDIAAGLIEEIDCASPEGVAIVEQNNIEAIPSLLLLDCHGNIIMPV